MLGVTRPNLDGSKVRDRLLKFLDPDRSDPPLARIPLRRDGSWDPCHSSALLEHLEVLLEAVDAPPLAAGDLAQKSGELLGAFSIFAPKLQKPFPLFQCSTEGPSNNHQVTERLSICRLGCYCRPPEPFLSNKRTGWGQVPKVTSFRLFRLILQHHTRSPCQQLRPIPPSPPGPSRRRLVGPSLRWRSR